MARKFALASVLLAVMTFANHGAAAQDKTKPEQAKPPQTKQPERIAAGDLKKKLDSGEKFLLIDVREDWELKQDGAIPGAIHIPVGELDGRTKDIPKDVELVFY